MKGIAMVIAIGIVITGHISAGRLEDNRLVDAPLRYPVDTTELDAPAAGPSGELLDIMTDQIERLAGKDASSVDAIGVAVPGIVRYGIIEESPNLPQIKG